MFEVVVVMVQATDLGTPPQSSLCHVVVYVGDVNDHSPEFGEDAYYMAVHEDTPGGTTVIHVSGGSGGSGRHSCEWWECQALM
jgi:hypothetical protein